MKSTEAMLGPSAVFQALAAYQETEALRAAIEIDLFTALGAGAATAKEIAARCNASERGVRILADYLVVNGFLGKDGGRYGPLRHHARPVQPEGRDRRRRLEERPRGGRGERARGWDRGPLPDAPRERLRGRLRLGLRPRAAHQHPPPLRSGRLRDAARQGPPGAQARRPRRGGRDGARREPRGAGRCRGVRARDAGRHPRGRRLHLRRVRAHVPERRLRAQRAPRARAVAAAGGDLLPLSAHTAQRAAHPLLTRASSGPMPDSLRFPERRPEWPCSWPTCSRATSTPRTPLPGIQSS